MKDKLILVKLDADYCNYLRKYDNKVPYNYGKKELRPFVGVLFEVNDCMYFAPLSSPKAKHLRLKSKMDFFKIDKSKLGAINFNNMIPFTVDNIIKIDLDKKVSNKKEAKYIKLLNEQIYWLNRHSDSLLNRTKSLYDKYVNNNLPISIASRCCNFKLLEGKHMEYNKVVVQ